MEVDREDRLLGGLPCLLCSPPRRGFLFQYRTVWDRVGGRPREGWSSQQAGATGDEIRGMKRDHDSDNLKRIRCLLRWRF